MQAAFAGIERIRNIAVEQSVAGRLLPYFFTADHKLVVNRLNSHVSHAASRYLKDAISKVNTKNRYYLIEDVEISKTPIGFTIVVETKPNDDIWYAQRVRRYGLSPLVAGRSAPLTNKYTVVLKQFDEDKTGETYILISAWIGPKTVPEIEDLTKIRHHDRAGYQLNDCLKFWAAHAFVINHVWYYAETLTKDRNASPIVPWSEPTNALPSAGVTSFTAYSHPRFACSPQLQGGA